MSRRTLTCHKEDYRVDEQRTVKMLLLDRDRAQATLTVLPADVQRFYNDNLSQYQTPEEIRASHILLNTAGKEEAAVRAQAEDLLKQLEAGADFAMLATEFSEDTGTATNGGDLDYFSRGRMVPEFETAAFALEPGQTSDIVQTQYGFHIIKVVDKRPAVTQPFDDVRPQIEDQLKRQRADQQITARASDFAGRIDDPADLDTVASGAGLTVSETDFFGRGDPVPGLGVAPQVALAAFQLDDDQVSAPIPSPRGPVFVTVTGKQEPYVPMLDEVEGSVREDVIRAHATELGRQRATAIAATLRSASDFAAAAAAQGFEARETELIAREAPLPDIGVSPEVDRAVFGLPAGGVTEPIATNDATVIVRVVERDDVTPEELLLGKDGLSRAVPWRAPHALLCRVHGQGEGADAHRDPTGRRHAHAGRRRLWGGPCLVRRTRPLSLTPATARFPSATSRTQKASAPAARRAGTFGSAL